MEDNCFCYDCQRGFLDDNPDQNADGCPRCGSDNWDIDTTHDYD